MTQKGDQTNEEETEEQRLAVSRRSWLKLFGATGGASLLTSQRASAIPSGGWTVVALPDTQYYADNDSSYSGFPEHEENQANWISNNLSSENIVFVTHEGDVVQNGDDTVEWENMADARDILDASGVRWSVLPGNHDWATTSDKSSSIADYKSYFGPSHFSGRSWFGGSGPSSGDNANINTYQLFSAGGYDFLHLALEWQPDGPASDSSTPLGWAQDVLDQHSDRPAIITTHEYLYTNGNRTGPGNTVFNELVAPNPQVFLVLCGHKHDEARRVSTNDAGLNVYQFLANYQNVTNGGNGYLRQYQFLPGGASSGSSEDDRLQVKTYSPSLDENQTDSDSQFGYDLTFSDRFDPNNWTIPESTSFQNGSNSYSGTVDTLLHQGNPATSYGSDQTITVDQDDGGNKAQGLLRFNNIFGSGSNQIPPGSTINTATLTVENVNNSEGRADHDPVEIYRVLKDWSESDTWNTAFDGDGIQTDGTDAVSTPDDTTDNVTNRDATGPETLDVTTSVQSWADGATNDGWALLNTGGDGMDIATSENSGEPKPKLEVYYEPESGGADELSVQTKPASDVTSTSATLNAEVTDFGGGSLEKAHFQYWKKGLESTTKKWTDNKDLASPGSYTGTAPNLDLDTAYVARAHVKNSNGVWATGGTVEFTTTTSSLSVSTEPVADITSTSATLNAEVTDFGGGSIEKAHFQYWEKSQEESTKKWTDNKDLASPGSYTGTAPNLDPDTTYVARAHVKNSNGVWATGGTVEFTTTTSSLAVLTEPASNVTATSATLNAEVTDFGGGSIEKAHFQYWAKDQESTTKQWTGNKDLASPGPYTGAALDLGSDTTYVARAHVKNSNGVWATGGTVEFITNNNNMK